ncbi:MAG: hypothetical protein AAGG08_09250 [Actinomycetota bacterium]
MYVTRHTNVTDPAVVDSLWRLYELAYDEIAGQDITRETLFRHEFVEVLADSTYRTTVVRSDDGSPIAMAVIATDIGVTRYLSVPYFRRRYPDRLAAGRIHYIMWILVHPDHQNTRATYELARAGLAPEVEDGTLLVFDLPESNQPNEAGGGAEFFRRVAKTLAEVQLESFGMSRYYALDFAPAEAEFDRVVELERVEDAATESEVESASGTA